MFDRMLWQDNVRDPARTYKATQNADGTVTMEPAGKLMQQGTNQSAENFNRMEDAIQDSQIAQQIIFQHQLQFEAGRSGGGQRAERLGKNYLAALPQRAAAPFGRHSARGRLRFVRRRGRGEETPGLCGGHPAVLH